jgi:type I restriction enzyme S subunit
MKESGSSPSIPPGYKQTEVGVIPEEWSVTTIGEQSQIFGRIGFRGYTVDDIVEEGHGAIAINPSNIKDSETVFDKCTYITWHKYEESPEIKIDEGDIILVKTGSTVGKTAIVKKLPEKATLNPQVVVFKKLMTSPGFFGYTMGFRVVQKQLTETVVGGAVPTLSQKQVATFKFPLPPLPEQRAIATALSDVDALLSGLERLITKKRDLKQAAMQQLLTGQTRLPGFHREWEVKRLGDHVTFLRNGVNSRAELLQGGQVKYLHYGDIHASEGSFLSPQILPTLSESKAAGLERLRDGDLIFADASEDIAGVSKSVELRDTGDIQVVSGLHTIAARFDKTVLADGFKGFLQYCPTFSTHLRRLAAGTKVYATNRAHIASVEIRLPLVAEQTAIATVLSDMDVELAALEARRAKARDLKQAMMQELLTGKTRLV